MLRFVLPAALALFSFLSHANATNGQLQRLLGGTVSAPVSEHDAGAGHRDTISPDATIVRSRTVRASTTLVASLAADMRSGEQARFILDLFDGIELVGTVVAVDETAQGGVSIDVAIDAAPGSRAVLVQNGDILVGSLNHAGVAYSIGSTPDGLQRVAEVDTRAFAEELPSLVPPTPRVAPDAQMAPDVPQDSGRLIDLMVVYTSQARDQAGGTAAIEARIALGVAETNIAYRNSGVAQRLRLVHVQEVAYAEPAGMSAMLLNLTDGLVPGVHTLRDTHGADLVKMVVAQNPGGCGIAWLFGELGYNWQAYGYSVTAHNCISPGYTFAHELGHNMGAAHEPGNGEPYGPRLYNRGYTPGYGWRDLMTYGQACSNCTRRLAFSNPRLTSPVSPIGPMGTADTHNIAHILNLTAKSIANYRPTNTTLHPVAQRFSDVPKGHLLYGHVEFMAQAEITSGCGGAAYCPDQPVTRRQMAVFLERALRASNWNPPAATGVFGDVPPASQFAGFVEALETDAITQGCAPGAFCPEQSVTREQMALFILRSRCGASYAPLAPASATFADVPTNHPSFATIEKLVSMGISAGCASSPARFCPATPVTRIQMAAFIERAYPFVFGLAPAEACAP